MVVVCDRRGGTGVEQLNHCNCDDLGVTVHILPNVSATPVQHTVQLCAPASPRAVGLQSKCITCQGLKA